jgi:hypothetical protein
MKTLDLSDYDWSQHPGSYDEDDRLHTHLGSANVIVDFAAQRIGLKVKKDGGTHCVCYPLDEIPIDIVGEWRPE